MAETEAWDALEKMPVLNVGKKVKKSRRGGCTFLASGSVLEMAL